MIKEGLRQVKRFNWQKTGEQTLKVYRDVFKDSAGTKIQANKNG